MKRLFFTLTLCLGIVACNKPDNEVKFPDNGVGDGSGGDKSSITHYKGALIPDDDYGAEMVALLNILDQSSGEIDDTLFVEELTGMIFNCEERYIYIHDLTGEDPDFWSSAADWVGGQMFYDLMMNDDGTLYCRHSLGTADPDFGTYMYDLGYKGCHSTANWRYDAESNTLYTGADLQYVAQVLHLDDKFAILEGHVYPMAIYEGEGYKRSSPMELYYFKFDSGRNNYLDGYELTTEELYEMRHEFEETYYKFEGKYLPFNGAAAQQKMRECIALLGVQSEEDIDDVRFVEMLTTKRLYSEDRFSTSAESECWSWGRYTATEEFGEVLTNGDMAAREDMTYASRISIYKENKKYDALTAAGYLGWKKEGEWSYDAESNTLTTTYDGKSYTAKVYYFDSASGEVVLRGLTGVLFNGYYRDEEIIRCKFYDYTPQSYLNGYLDYSEFVELWQTL